MSTAPNFSAVLFVDKDKLSLFYLPQKNWHRLDEELALKKPIPDEAKQRLQGENVLLLISDHFNGHLQFTQENKKSLLERDAVLAKLEDDFDIDTEAYHLNWQSFTVNRQVMQLSVSGIEQEIINEVIAWLSSAQPKKVWAMPFAWFVSTLKSVDPALIAVYEDERVHVSHHYLGVDDARVLSLEDLEKYVTARREERKDTHLLYVAASNQDRSALDQAVSTKEVTTQSLLEESSSDVLLDVVSQAAAKGQGSWGELWHLDLSDQFELEDSSENEDEDEDEESDFAVASSNPKSASEDNSASQDEAQTAASSLPVPTPPPGVGDVDDAKVEVEVASKKVDTSSTDQLEETSPEKAPPVDDEKPQLSLPAKKDEQKAEEPEEEREQQDQKDKDPVTAKKDQKSASNAAAASSAVAASSETASSAVETDSVEDDDDAPVEKVEKTQEVEADTKSESLPAEDIDNSATKERPLLSEQLKGSGVKVNNVERYADVETSRSWKGPIVVFLLVVVITALVGGAVFWSQEGQQYLGFIDTFVEQPAPAPSPTPVATPEPTPAATAEAELTPESPVTDEQRENTSIIILNATGIAGLAGRTRTQLQSEGWQNIDVGNATGTYNDADFIVSQDEALTAALSADLERELRSVESVKEPQAGDYDVVIILASD